MRALRAAVVAALVLLALPLVRPGTAASYTVPCTGNGSVDGTALQTLVNGVTPTNDTITLTAPCTYVITQTLAVTGRTLVLTTTGGQVTLQANGVRLLTVAADGRLDADHLSLTFGDDTATGSGGGRGGNATVDGVLTLTDSELTSGKGGLGGNLEVGASGHATLVRTALLGGSGTAEAASVQGRLSLIDSLVTTTPGSGVGIRLSGSGAGAEVFHDTFVTDGVPTALDVQGGLAQVAGSAFSGSATTCGGTGFQFVGTSFSDDLCPGMTNQDPLVHAITGPPGVVSYAVPAAGSPVIDAGDLTTCQHTTSAQGFYAGPTDGRGRPRVSGASCDVGAYESQGRVQYDTVPALTPTSPTVTLRLTDTGTDDVRLGKAPSLPPGFSAGTTTCDDILPVGSSCTWEVSYVPTATQQDGFFSVPDNAGGFARAHLVGQPVVVPPPPTPTATPTRAPRPTPTPTAPVPTTLPRIPAPSPTARPVLPTTQPSPLVPSPTPSPPTATASPSAPPVVAVPLAQSRGSGSWHARHADRALPWFVRNLRTADEVDTTPGTVARNVLLALLLLALLNVPVNLINKALEEHGGDLARLLAGARRRVPNVRLRWRVPAPLKLALAVVVSSAISALLDPGAGLDRETAVTFGGLLIGIGLISSVATSVEDTWCEKRLRVRATLRLFPGFWLLSVACLVVSRVVGLHPGLVLGTLAGLSAARSLSAVEDGQRVLVVQVAVLALGAYSWTAYGPLAHDAQRTHALHTEVLAAATGTVFVGVLGGALMSLVPIGSLDGAVLRRWSTPVWAMVTFVALFGFVAVLLHDDGSDPLLQHPVYLAALLGLYLVAAAAFLGFWRWYERSPRAEQLRARHTRVADA